jgi:hypothetical protein
MILLGASLALRIYWAELLRAYLWIRRWIFVEVAKGDLETRLQTLASVTGDAYAFANFARSMAVSFIPGIGLVLRWLIDYIIDAGMDFWLREATRMFDLPEIYEADPILMCMSSLLVKAGYAKVGEVEDMLVVDLAEMILYCDQNGCA